MRNLKKVLSLVLCVAVMLSVMVLGAGAAFSDQDQIENTEAVDACSALNIIGGYEDGSFHPERNIKRSEITKMICVALNGGSEPNVSTNAVPTFSDVRGTSAEWAEGYIEACVAQGIVSGVGGGRFAPDGNVTGAQLAKMLLVCLGYNSDNEGFTGNAWETNVNVRAAQKDLYEGLEDMDTSAAVTRDQAAQMVWNALQAYEVEYKTNLVTDENGNLITQVVVQDKVVASTNDKITLLADKYEAYINVGTLTKIDGKTLNIVMSSADEADSHDKTLTEFLNLNVDYSGLLGQKVKVMFTKSNNVLGVYATGDNTVVTANQKDIDVDSGKLNINGTNYTLESDGVTLYIDGAVAANKYKAGDFTDSQSASVLTFVDSDGNDKIDTAWETTYEVGKVTYVSSSQVIIGGKTYKAEEENIDSNLAKDDWAIITHDLYNSNLDIVKADVATGKVNATKDKSGWKQFQIDETWYNETNSADGDVQSNVKAGVDAEYVAVNGILFYAKKTSGVTDHLTDVLFVAYHGTDGLANNQARVMFPNGTEETIDLKNNYVEDQNGAKSTVDPDGAGSSTYAAGDIANGAVYEYYKSGSKYQLVELDNTADAYGDYTTIKDSASDGVKLNTSGKIASVEDYAIDDGADVIVFTANSGDATKYSIKHITGKQLKTFTATAGPNDNNINDTVIAAFESDVNGLTRATALFVRYNSTTGVFGSNMDSISAYANYGFITKDAVRVGNDQIKFNVWTGSEDVEVYADQTNETKFAKGTIIGYDSIAADSNGNNIIDDIFAIPLQSGMTSGVVAGSITSARNDGEKFVVGGTEYDVDDFSTVLYVSTSDKDETIGIVDGKATAAHDPLKDDDKRATNILYYGKEVAVIDVNEIAGETYANHVLFDGIKNGGTDVEGVAEFSSVQWLNNRTGDTDNSKAYDNAQMTLSFYSTTAGTLKLSGVNDATSGSPYSIDVKVGTNKIEDLYVTGNVVVEDWNGKATPSGSVLTDPDVFAIGTAFASNDTVTVKGKVPTAFEVPTSKTLVLETATLQNATTITGNGTVQVKSLDAAGKDITAASATVDLTGATIYNDGSLTGLSIVKDDTATVDAARVTKLLDYAGTVTVKNVSGALTVSDPGKTLNMGDADAAVSVTNGTVNAASVAGKLDVDDGTVTVTGSVGEIDVASTKSATVGSVTNWTTAVVAGTLKVTAAQTGTISLPSGVAATGKIEFAGDVTAATIAVDGVTGAAEITFSGAVDAQKVTNASDNTNVVVKFADAATITYAKGGAVKYYDGSNTELNADTDLKLTASNNGFKWSTSADGSTGKGWVRQ